MSAAPKNDRIRRGIAVALAVAGGGAIWWGWENLGLLRGTPVWEHRYLALAVAAFLLLTALDRLSPK